MNTPAGRSPLRRAAKGLIAFALCAALVAAPAPAAAYVTVTVEFVYGGIVVGCVGIFVAIGGTWDMPFVRRPLQTALIEVGPAGTSLGVPVPSFAAAADQPDGAAARGGVQLDVVRWSF